MKNCEFGFFFFFFGLTLRDKLVHQLHKTSMKNDLIIACSLQHRREPAYNILSSMWAGSKANLRKHLCISKAKIYSLHVNSENVRICVQKFDLNWKKNGYGKWWDSTPEMTDSSFAVLKLPKLQASIYYMLNAPPCLSSVW